MKEEKVDLATKNKLDLQNRVDVYQEKLRLLELAEKEFNLNISHNLNSSLNSSLNIIDHNIKHSKHKEIQKTKKDLNERLLLFEVQLKEIEREEKIQNLGNHYDIIKKFKTNFEEDQKKVESKVKEWESKRQKNMKIFTERKEKLEQQALDYVEELKEKEREKLEERAENYREKLNKLKERNENNHIHIDKVKEELEDEKSKSKPVPLFKINEKKALEKEREKREEYEQKIFDDKQKRKELYRSINHDEIQGYKRKLEDDFNEKKQEKEKQRSEKLQEIDTANKELPKQDSEKVKLLIENDIAQSKVLEHQKEELIAKHIKVKHYTKGLKHLRPKVSPEKRKEMEKLKAKFTTIGKLKKVESNILPHHKVHKSVLFHKYDTSKPHRLNSKGKEFQYKIVQDGSTSGRNKHKRKHSVPSPSRSLDDSIVSLDKKIKALGRDNKHIPHKPKDYLKEIRIKREIELNNSKLHSEGSAGGHEDDVDNSFGTYEREAGKSTYIHTLLN